MALRAFFEAGRYGARCSQRCKYIGERARHIGDVTGTYVWVLTQLAGPVGSSRTLLWQEV